MKPVENIEKLIKNLDLDIDIRAETERLILRELIEAHEKSKKMKSALVEPNIRRIIMKSPITKLAAAAVIITAVTLGLFEFIGTDNKSGVVWAEVARKVQASRGVIFRSTDADGGGGYAIHYHCSTQYRNDSYKGGQIVRTMHGDFNTNIVLLISHHRKTYATKTFEKLEQGRFWADPKSVIQKFLSHEHRELGAKTIEGVVCEGIETTDPAFAGVSFPLESLMARVWVSVETGYPIQLECEISGYNGEDGQLLRSAVIADQFQWDVELDPSLFEPNIPPDYIDISL